MSKPAFTPGPWELRPSTLNGLCIYAGEYGIGKAWDINGNPENAANAALIAAAPDMYEALIAAKQSMWESARHQWNLADFKNWAVVQQIDAALQRADGIERTKAEGCHD